MSERQGDWEKKKERIHTCNQLFYHCDRVRQRNAEKNKVGEKKRKREKERERERAKVNGTGKSTKAESKKQTRIKPLQCFTSCVP